MQPLRRNKCNIFIIVLLFAFLFVSCWFMIPHNSEERPMICSSELAVRVRIDGDETIEEYVDNGGQIVFAADIGYAIKVNRKTENGIIETHFDAEKKAITFKNRNYYAILREYDDSGNNVRMTYLDSNSIPVNNAYGYATIIRQFSEDGLVKKERFLDENGNPISSGVFGFAKFNEYDEYGRLVRQTYLNDINEPIITELGYASVSYTYYESDGSEYGNIDTEFYYDNEGHPICLPDGQYGVHKEYDECGRTSVMTYLDRNGEPSIINKGYATIRFTYKNDNTVLSEMYYDENGAPVRLAGGQYGIKYDQGNVIFLDAEGNKQFNIMRSLLNKQYVVVLVAISLVFVSRRVSKQVAKVTLIAYCGFVVFATLMYRETGTSRMNLEVLWAYKRFFSSREARVDVLNNIWFFIPIGALLFKLHPKNVILIIPLVFSLAIEVVQFFTGTGLCEADDLISNSLGSCLGYEAAYICSLIRNNTDLPG